jgi:hypothetical protein
MGPALDHDPPIYISHIAVITALPGLWIEMGVSPSVLHFSSCCFFYIRLLCFCSSVSPLLPFVLNIFQCTILILCWFLFLL